MKKKIIKNCIKCNYCGDIIISENRHDFKACSCGIVAVDGVTDYLRRNSAVLFFIIVVKYT